MAKVSVIIPVYGVECYIEKCAQSLFEQSLEDMEFIFVDDCSPDNSMAILNNVLERYPERKKQTQFVHHKANKGLTAARNSGLAVATGEYVVHCDSDDWVALDMYEIMYDRAVKDNADIVYCDINMVYAESTDYYKTAELAENRTQFLRNYITCDWTCLVNMLVRREIYIEHRLKSPMHIGYGEDFWLSVRLYYYANRISKVDAAFYQYNRLNETSIVHTLNKKAESDEITCNLESISFFEEKGILELLEREMSWRILKSKQECVLDTNRFDEFLSIYPQSHKYICSNPFCHTKIKCMMWLLVHHCRLVNLLIVRMRTLLGR